MTTKAAQLWRDYQDLVNRYLDEMDPEKKAALDVLCKAASTLIQRNADREYRRLAKRS